MGLELGNDEALNDMKRNYETIIDIKPAKFQVAYESGAESQDDIDSIQSDFYESALEQIERNFGDFDPVRINVTKPAAVTNMWFEKKAFFYWLDEGMVEISVELSADLTGTWTH